MTRTLAILYDSITPTIKEMSRLEKDLKIVYYSGKPFELDSLAFVAREAETVLVDDRVFDEVAPVLEQRPWPLSIVEEALEKRGPGPVRFVSQSPPPEPIPQTFPGPVLFVACNDTHVKMLHPIAKQIPQHQFVAIDKEEQADVYLRVLGEHFWLYPRVRNGHTSASFLKRVGRKVTGRVWRNLKRGLEVRPVHISLGNIDPCTVVFCTDWGPEERELCDWARKRGIPSVCIQEGQQDFEMPGYDQYQRVDHVLVQGAITTKYLDRDAFIITGNPRLSGLSASPLPEKPLVMINANFTYGIYEDWRERWMEAVIAACRAVGVEFFISRHPRDFGEYRDLPVIDSGAFKLHDQIARSSVLVTRFSQVLYEAMLMGRPVIYFNPHREVKKTLTEDRTGAIVFAATRDELHAALTKALAPSQDFVSAMEDFLAIHCGPNDGLATERCLIALAAIANKRILPLGDPRKT